jgi:hypothetical protein
MMRIRQLRGWLMRLFGLFTRKQREQEFAEELESHPQSISRWRSLRRGESISV